MPKRTLRIGAGEPLLDIVSLGRGGPHGSGAQITTAQVEHIRRTVQRVPEVMVKVLGRNSNDLKAAAKHLDYIGRKGKLELETDDGERLQGRVGESLLEDWDLDIDDARRQGDLKATDGRKPPRLVHKLMFSMPPGTPPSKVLGAVRNFARQEFALQHRYALVLHTDEAHPHVHLVLKAVSETGVRLNIKKATLRHWRAEFAKNLRLLGVEANSTERAVRGEPRKSKKDGIYRAELRGALMRRDESAGESSTTKGRWRNDEPGTDIAPMRKEIELAWRAVGDILASDGNARIAEQIHRFVDQKRLPRRADELIARSPRERGSEAQPGKEKTTR